MKKTITYSEIEAKDIIAKAEGVSFDEIEIKTGLMYIFFLSLFTGFLVGITIGIIIS